MIDVQKIITEIILYRIRKCVGSIMAVVGFFVLVGSEYTVKYTTENAWGQILFGIALLIVGTAMSEAFQWEYEIPNWREDYRGTISYSFKMHSWIRAWSYTSNDNCTYVLCDLYGRKMSNPIRTHRSFLGFKWYSLR
jgi:hypothetical protein